MSISADAGKLTIVIFPQSDEDPTFKVVLMGLKGGELDWDAPHFILSRSHDLPTAVNYAKELADILKIKVMQIA